MTWPWGKGVGQTLYVFHPVVQCGVQPKELELFFEKCINELPDEYRIPYILKDVEKLSEDQVCEILRLRKPIMKNRVHRTRSVIRKRVEDRFFNPT